MKISISELKQIIQEEIDSLDEGGYGEGSMARSQLGRTAEVALMLQDMIGDDTNLEEWVESKITKSQDYLSSVLNYMRGEQLSERELSKSEKDEKEDIVKGMKKNTKDFEKRYGKDAKSVMYGAATNIAKKNKGKKVKEGLEQLTPENMELLFDVFKKMATEPAIVTALGMGGMVAAIDKMKDMVMKDQNPPSGVSGTTSPDGPDMTSGASE